MGHLQLMNRYRAFGVHILLSTGVGIVGAIMVFGVWYPGVLAYASNVTAIFLTLLAVDVVIGPVITLVIFNPQKKELKRDLMIVAALQAAALFYGMHTVFIARPAYIVFNAGQFDVAYANDISDQNVAKAHASQFQSLPLFAPKTVSVKLPDDPKELGNIIMSSLSGGEDPYLQPQYYVDYLSQKKLILLALKPLEKLYDYNKEDKQLVLKLIEKYRQQKMSVAYLPLKGKAHNATVVINHETAEILEMSVLKPLP